MSSSIFVRKTCSCIKYRKRKAESPKILWFGENESFESTFGRVESLRSIMLIMARLPCERCKTRAAMAGAAVSWLKLKKPVTSRANGEATKNEIP